MERPENINIHSLTDKNGIKYLLDDNDNLIKYKPWMSDILSFLYDRIMVKSVFPKKFNASIDRHYEILRTIFENIYNKTIIEFATGSGDAVKFLDNNNIYAGVDISSGLLNIAQKKFDLYGYDNFELYCIDVCDTPFQNNTFDIAICNLSLNFFHSIDKFLTELHRVLKMNGMFYCSVPVPERRGNNAVIHGKLYKVDDLEIMFANKSFSFEALPYENGALLYFRAILNYK